jgi:hypothetical protein
MTRYLWSVHSREGEARPAMSDAEMQEFFARVGALEAEMKSAGAPSCSAGASPNPPRQPSCARPRAG